MSEIDCSKCPHILYILQQQTAQKNDIDEVEKALCEKVSFSTFKWIVGALCAAAILVFGFNISEIKSVGVKIDGIVTQVMNIDKEVMIIKKVLEK